MKRLTIILVVTTVAIALVAVAIAQTPEDEQLIADFIEARGFNLTDERATRISGMWLEDIENLRPTFEAFVASAGQQVVTETPTPPAQSRMVNRRRECWLRKSIIRESEEPLVFLAGGQPGELVSVTIEGTTVLSTGETQYASHFGAMLDMALSPLPAGTYVVRCNWVGLGLIPHTEDLVVLREVPQPTDDPRPTPVPGPTAEIYRWCGRARERREEPFTRYRPNESVTVHFYGGSPGEMVGFFLTEAQGDSGEPGAEGDQAGPSGRARTIHHSKFGAFATISLTFDDPNDVDAQFILQCEWVGRADFVENRHMIEIIDPNADPPPVPPAATLTFDPEREKARAFNCHPQHLPFDRQQGIGVIFRGGLPNQAISLREHLIVQPQPPFNQEVTGFMNEDTQLNTAKDTVLFADWLPRDKEGTTVLECLWGGIVMDRVIVEWSTRLVHSTFPWTPTPDGSRGN